MRRGFTLVEIAIVLVIIGLIVGGVMVGRTLIEAANVRAQITQIEKLNTATNTFKLKYNGLPADLNPTRAASFGLRLIPVANASRFDNGFIDGSASTTLEGITFLTHLQQANLIECTGCNPAVIDWVTGSTWDGAFTKAKINSGANVEIYGGNVPAGENGTEQNYSNNYFEIVQSRSSTSRAMTPVQAFALDNKVDNGLPLTGRVIATNNPGQNFWGDYWNGTRTPSQAAAGGNACVSTSSSPSVYNSTNSNLLCNVRFEAQF